jgi:hypothetical protein
MMITTDTYEVPEAPPVPSEKPVALNPDYFLRLEVLQPKRSRPRSLASPKACAKRASPICERCLYGHHNQCAKCGCVCLGEFRGYVALNLEDVKESCMK